MSLFKLGTFMSHSGIPLAWKIDCDVLTDADWECLASIGRGLVGPFQKVYWAPMGGMPLAMAMERYRDPTSGKFLVVDDVFTTGKSITEIRDSLVKWGIASDDIIGLAVFARDGDLLPNWCRAIFTLSTLVKGVL